MRKSKKVVDLKEKKELKNIHPTVITLYESELEGELIENLNNIGIELDKKDIFRFVYSTFFAMNISEIDISDILNDKLKTDICNLENLSFKTNLVDILNLIFHIRFFSKAIMSQAFNILITTMKKYILDDIYLDEIYFYNRFKLAIDRSNKKLPILKFEIINPDFNTNIKGE